MEDAASPAADFRPLTSFNGATTLTSWKTPAALGRPWLADRSLQWGHDFDVVEDNQEQANFRIPELLLQWGHDFDVVEDNREPMHRLSESIRFNGATTLTSWKTRGGRRPFGRFASFNGATTLTSWKTIQRLSVVLA